MKSRLERMLKGCDAPVLREDLRLCGLLPNLAKITNRRIVFYGAGKMGLRALAWIRKHNHEPLFFLDADRKKKNQTIEGIRIIHTDDLAREITPNEDFFIVITTVAWLDPVEQMRIANCLSEAGCGEVMWLGAFDNELFMDWKRYYADNADQILEFHDLLSDEESRRACVEYVRCVMHGDFYREAEHDTAEKYFGNELIQLGDDEYFANAGSAAGETLVRFLVKTGLRIGGLYGFDGSTAWCELARRYLSMLPNEISKKTEICETILSGNKETSLDCLMREKKVTILALDVEGAELEVLRGAQHLIAAQQPVLSISIYHKKEDFVEIPEFIRDLPGEYSMYLRKYHSCSTFLGHSKDEMILYAFPARRLAARS